MKKFKRLIALVTVAMFVLSFTAPAAFAADTTAAATAKRVIGKDVAGTKYSTPSKKLIALGIINGFEDGTIRPESDVTRAQFAAIVAKELGLGDVSPSPTKFKDVPASHWASGAINLAVGKGIIHGYPDGTFRPEQPVTFAEASAMLMQMLGYGPALKAGTWPATPISLAAQAGVSKGVNLASNAKVPRGEVIIMAANALDADIMEQDTWGDENTWKKKEGKTILSEVFDIEVLDEDGTMPVVDLVPRFALDTLKSNEIEFKGVANTYKVNEYFDPNQFMGQEVQVWVNEDDDEIFYIDNSENETVINDTIEDWNTADNKIKLDKKDKWYQVLDPADEMVTPIYVNTDGTPISWNTLEGLDLANLKNADVKVVLNDDDKIVAIVITDYYNNVDYTTKSGFVKSVNADKEIITYYNEAGDETDLDLDDADYAVVKDGITSTLADLKADDVLNILYDGTEYFIVATANKVSGKVEKVITSNTANTTDYDIYIGGKKYDVANECTFSDDNNDSVAAVDTDDLDDLTDKEATLLLDAQGKIKHIVTKEATESTKLYGIIAKTPQLGSYDEVKLTLVNKSGVEQVFTFDYDDVKVNGSKLASKNAWVSTFDLNAADTTNYVIFVEYKLDSSGKLTDVNPVNMAADMDNATDVKVDASENAIDLSGGAFKVTDKTVIWDATKPVDTDAVAGIDKLDDLRTVSWASLDDRTVDVWAKTKGAEVEYLIVVATDKNLGAGGNYGVVKGFTTKGGDAAIVLIDNNGDEKIYVWDEAVLASATQYVYGLDRSAVSKIAKGDFVYYSLKGEGDSAEIDEIATLAFHDNYTNVIAADGDVQVDSIKVAKVNISSSTYIKADTVDPANGAVTDDNKYYVVNSDTKYFDIHDTADLKKVTGVAANDIVILIDTDDDSSTIDYVIIVQS